MDSWAGGTFFVLLAILSLAQVHAFKGDDFEEWLETWGQTERFLILERRTSHSKAAQSR